MDANVSRLAEAGFVCIANEFTNVDQAFELAHELVAAAWSQHGGAPLSVIGDFNLPPVGGQPNRDFQTLHFDFGLPLNPQVEQDVGRYTALHVAKEVVSTSAVTRIVPLAPLLSQRDWPAQDELLARLVAYGQTHGAWDDSRGYVEGSLARLVEAAAGAAALPSVKLDNEFLCGNEFDELQSEIAFFTRHSLSIEAAQTEVALQPGELLVFDNLAVAHGRRGSRQPGELHQRVFGQPSLGIAAQEALRDQLLKAF